MLKKELGHTASQRAMRNKNFKKIEKAVKRKKQPKANRCKLLFNPFTPRDFAEKRVLKLVEWFLDTVVL